MANLVLLVVPKEPVFTVERLDRLSEIFANIGIVALGSVVVPYLFDKYDLSIVILGVVTSLVFWFVSIWVAGKGG